MPGFDGTGPGGLGPMTGRGEGYCAIVLPSPRTAKAPFDYAQDRPYGYAGLAGVPVRLALSPVEGMSYPYGRPPAYGPASSVAAAPYAPFGRLRRGMRFVRSRGKGRGPSSRSGRGRRRW